MSKFQITLIRPRGYLHTEAFRELAETLQAGLETLGHSSHIQENCFPPDCTNVILGAHLLAPEQMQLIPQGSVIYNLEQLGGAQLKPAYYQLAVRYRIWDYDLRNIAHWKQFACAYAPVHVPIGYVPELSRITASPLQDIDVLFYGSLNPRRNQILNALKDAGIKVHAVFGIYGKDRDDLIARSKIVLNIHFYESKVFEIARVSYLLANSKAIVTESSGTEMENGLSLAVLSLPYERLVEGCRSLLQNDTERRAFEARGFQWFSQRKESDILSNALQPTTEPTTTTNAINAIKAIEIPRKLNLGSGKDWREDYFNADFDPYWEPDAVVDFGRPLPIGQPLETVRFGSAILQNNYFDEIIANDALEHIPNLSLAMTSCLNLLRVGGVFRIAVPYDLSWGAWQDPTHVRAFNERSWLYYTDWFWYMGWTESRFDIAQFDLGLSPIGEALARQQVKGEDLVRHPRAVDQMRVTLRKRLLTEAEKLQVLRFLKRPNRGAGRAAETVLTTPPAIASSVQARPTGTPA
jgi:SAM-dependent methyltransferase